MINLKKILILFVLVLLTNTSIFSQTILDLKISLKSENKSIEDILQQIQSISNVNFSYSKSIINLSSITSINCNSESLENVLIKLFENQDIIFTEVSDIIILRKKPQNADNIKIKGKIYDSNSNNPIEFAGFQLLNTTIGTISNQTGEFSLIIKKAQTSDTLLISALGFERQKILVSEIQNNPDTIIMMKSISILLNEIEINPNDYLFKTLGNKKKFSNGAIYIDTHGQQTALFIENENNEKGKILSVNFYLSPKGNPMAPFRVRIYKSDSLTGEPSLDILPDVLIAKPKFSGGWFKINLSHYNIQIPENGFFVAIEGIYPVDKQTISEFDNYTETDNSQPQTISYGQQLGYSKKKGNNTWHYSLTHKWFQLDDNNFNVMISADIQQIKKKKND